MVKMGQVVVVRSGEIVIVVVQVVFRSCNVDCVPLGELVPHRLFIKTKGDFVTRSMLYVTFIGRWRYRVHNPVPLHVVRRLHKVS